MQGLKKIDEKKTWKTKCFRFQICILYVLWLQRTQRIVTYSSKKGKKVRVRARNFSYIFGPFYCFCLGYFIVMYGDDLCSAEDVNEKSGTLSRGFNRLTGKMNGIHVIYVNPRSNASL